jgi:signal peptidase I
VLVPGLGHVYLGRLRRAVALYLIWWSTALGCAVLVVKVPALSLLVIVAFLLFLRVVGFPGDAFRLARLHALGSRRPSGWYLYTAVIVLDVIVLPVVVAPVLLLPLMRMWSQAFVVPSASMEPTILVGDHILVDRAAYHLSNPFTGSVWWPFGDPRRGDVVVVMHPDDPSAMTVKRVVGLASETVEVRAERVLINGLPLTEPYLPPLPLPGAHQEIADVMGDWGPDRVPPGHVFVLGDNRDNSRDSRHWGSLPLDHVVGRVVRIYWSRTCVRDPLTGELSWSGPIRWDRLDRAVR